MSETKLADKRLSPPSEEEDSATCAAIEKGIADADAGRVTPIEKVQEMLKQWNSKSSFPTKH